MAFMAAHFRKYSNKGYFWKIDTCYSPPDVRPTHVVQKWPASLRFILGRADFFFFFFFCYPYASASPSIGMRPSLSQCPRVCFLPDEVWASVSSLFYCSSFPTRPPNACPRRVCHRSLSFFRIPLRPGPPRPACPPPTFQTSPTPPPPRVTASGFRSN